MGEEIGYRGEVTYIDQLADDTVGVSLDYVCLKSFFVLLQPSVSNYRECNFCGFTIIENMNMPNKIILDGEVSFRYKRTSELGL